MSNVAEDTLDELEKDLSSSPGSGRAEGAPPVASEEGGRIRHRPAETLVTGRRKVATITRITAGYGHDSYLISKPAFVTFADRPILRIIPIFLGPRGMADRRPANHTHFSPLIIDCSTFL